MGKRKKVHGKSEKIAPVKEKTFDSCQINIGDEFKRWMIVRESMCLSDEQLMKAILDLLEDRRVCPHGCYMKNVASVPEKRKIRPKLVRCVGTQIKTPKRSFGTQSELSKDHELLGEPDAGNHNQDCKTDNLSTAQSKLLSGSELDQSAPVTEDVRWKTLKTSHNISSDEQMSRALLDCVTADQEQAIKNLCLLREWPFPKYNPITEERAPSSERDYTVPSAVILDEPYIQHANVQQSNRNNKQNTGQFVSEVNRVIVREGNVVELYSGAGETTASVESDIRQATNIRLAECTVETSVLDSVTSANAEMQIGQNVPIYIPVTPVEYKDRDSDTVYKPVNIEQTNVKLQRNEGICKPVNSKLAQQRLQRPYTIQSLETSDIFPKTTASVLETSGPFTCSTQVDYEPFRRKIDESDPEQSQKYKKIRLTPTTYEAERVHEPVTPSGEQNCQLQPAPDYSYLQSGYTQGSEQGH